MIFEVAADEQLRYSLGVLATPTFWAKDIREFTTPAQREARAAELKAAAEEKARRKTGANKKLKDKVVTPKGGKPVAGTPSLSQEAKDAGECLGRRELL